MIKSLPQVSVSDGLSSNEARKRLVEVGPNVLERKKEYSVVGLLVSQFRSPLIYVLGFAGLATMYLREWTDAVVIWMVVVMNAVLGFWQEFKAAKSLEALKSYLKPKVKVVRDGSAQEVLMSELVPGDVVLLDPGVSVPADGVVVEAEDLSVNEAILTGESRPVSKSSEFRVRLEKGEVESLKMVGPQENKAKHYVYMGTAVSKGVGKMLVVATGQETEMGKIAESLVKTEEGDTPLQQKLSGLARVLMIVVVEVTVVIMVLGLLRGEELMHMFETAVALAVAAIPEGLAVSMTVILALGMQRILKRRALVRKLVAAETLGSVSVICCDKTGTLTEGKMKVVGAVGDRDELVRAAILANDERDEEGVAMNDWANKEMKKKRVSWTRLTRAREIRGKFGRIRALPFSSETKYAASLNQFGKKRVITLVGAPEVVMGKCYMGLSRKRSELAKVRMAAEKGYRLIGVASKNVANKGRGEQGGKLKKSDLHNMGWGGFLMFEDPIRKNVKESLMAAERAGVKVKVITGDYEETAVAVLEKLLGSKGRVGEDEVMTGEELVRLSKRQLKSRIDGVVLFARTTPDQKLKIVEVLRDKGEVVAMTGDGVNDAPALKAADIGVVVNEASDVSKQTADMVLLNSNFGTIVAAIREGRAIYETMRKVVAYLLTDAFQELVLIGGALIAGLPLPLSAVQILWINLVEDGLPGVALAFDRSDEEVMDENPRSREAPILDGEIRWLMLMIGVIANLVLLVLYVYLERRGYSHQHLQTFMFIAVGTNSLLYIFSIKSLKRSIWREKLFDNRYLLVAVAVGFSLMMAAMYVPVLRRFLGTVVLSPAEMGLVLLLSVMVIGMVEGVKWVFIRNAKIKTQNSK